MEGSATGTILGRRHLYPVRVHYPDTDAGGVVYHGAYLSLADRARTEFLRLIGWPFTRLQREYGLGWIVRRLVLDLRRPALLDDALVIATSLRGLGGASLDAVQSFVRATPGPVRSQVPGQIPGQVPGQVPSQVPGPSSGSGQRLADVELKLALVDRSGRPHRIPAALAADLVTFVEAR